MGDIHTSSSDVLTDPCPAQASKTCPGHVNGNRGIKCRWDMPARDTVSVLPAEFYGAYFSRDARERQPSFIRSLFPLELVPGMLSLLSGKPNPATFPITSLSVTVRSPNNPALDEIVDLSGEALQEGLQYSRSDGIPSLVNWFMGLQEISHRRKTDEGWRITMGTGSQDLIYKTFQVLLDPGDPVLVESPIYSGVIPIFKTLKSQILSVDIDECGIKPSSLRSILENWPPGKKMPRVLYTVPYACNPTGLTATEERRREVIELSIKYNFLIMEDDPYYYLYFGKTPRPPSYFALEKLAGEVGRVIRFDSLSKILSAGIRMGFASGPKRILDAIDELTATSNLQPSSLTQSITFAILDNWGYDVFFKHTEVVSEFYRQRCDVFEGAMKRHLDGLAEWITPEAGMFFWFKLLLSGPGTIEKPNQDSATLIRKKAFAAGVLALPGEVFMPNGEKSAYVRSAFSCLNDTEIDEAIRRLRKVVLDARVEPVCDAKH